jgi:hypothetical protein
MRAAIPAAFAAADAVTASAETDMSGPRLQARLPEATIV